MVSRRTFLTIGAGGVAAALSTRAAGQTPKRGGTLTLRAWDPPHFDHVLAHAYTTHVVLSFTHSRLLRHRAGPGVRPGAFLIEGDLAESWQQTGDTSYVFKFRKGVRFHAKPPVNGRELTADDVRYTFDRAASEKGSTNASMFCMVSTSRPTAPISATTTAGASSPRGWTADAAHIHCANQRSNGPSPRGASSPVTASPTRAPPRCPS